MTQGKVIVIGGANIDIKAKARGALLSATSNLGRVTQSPGGVAANIAHDLAKLDVAVSLMTVLGEDAAGREILAASEAARIDMSLCRRTSEATGMYVAILDAQGEMAVAVNAMEAMAELTPDWLAYHSGKLDEARFIIADCNIPRETLEWLTRYREKLIIEPVSVAKCRKIEKLAKPVLAATPNRKQAETLTGLPVGSIAEALKAAVMLAAIGIDHVVLTLGGDGAVVAGRDGKSAHIEPFALPKGDRRDVTGAGDAAVAGLVFGLLRGFAWPQAALLGQAAAALTVTSARSVTDELSCDRLLALSQSRMRVAG